MYKYIHTCIYIYTSCPHTYAHTHIYTYAYKMYIWTHAKHVWNDGAAATARAAHLDTKKLCPSPCPHHDSALSRPHPLICTGAEPSTLSTPAPSLAMAPWNEVIFLPFWRGQSCGQVATVFVRVLRGRILASQRNSSESYSCQPKRTHRLGIAERKIENQETRPFGLSSTIIRGGSNLFKKVPL